MGTADCRCRRRRQRFVGLLWRPGITPLAGTFRQIGRGDGGLWHAAASAAFDIGGSVPLTAVACHLDPFRPEVRFSEAARIVSLAVGKAAIVGGDFNCVSADRRSDGSFYDPDPIEQQGWHEAATFQVEWNDDLDAAPPSVRDVAGSSTQPPH